MNIPLTVGLVLLAIIGLAIVIEFNRERTKKRRRRALLTAPPKRSVHLERQMLKAFAGPRENYGDCFAEFTIVRQPDTTRMNVTTRGAWQFLGVFTRRLIIRHLWTSLRALAKGHVLVCVDLGAPDAVIWTSKETEEFNDCGVVAPWVAAKGRAGTLISGR
jgi:hypothetical protein